MEDVSGDDIARWSFQYMYMGFFPRSVTVSLDFC